MPPRSYVGTAGWSLPTAVQRHFPAGKSHLARYAQVLPAAEINTTFYRSHRAGTFSAWAASVPRGFRFAVKIPQALTHEQRLRKSARQIETFLAEIAPLGSRLGCLLAQLPPSLVFEPRVARAFFQELRKRYGAGVALEPRHASWFQPRVERLLCDFKIARVAADPPRAQGDGEPGGWPGLAYFRLHGSPRMYYSSYDEDFLESLEVKLRALSRRRIPAWCIFDNTASGAATGNALSLLRNLSG